MNKVFQTKFNNPATGETGNCFAACLATLLQISISEIPDDLYPSQRILDLIYSKGYRFISVYDEDDVPKDTFYIACGISPRNRNIKHAVIYQNGKLVHDPHPDSSGIITEEWYNYLEKL
jgi:hypothetical protein